MLIILIFSRMMSMPKLKTGVDAARSAKMITS